MSTVVSLSPKHGVNLPDDDARQAVIDRLGDPEVSESLLVLLDHADLLAVVVKSIDEFLRRADEIGETLGDAIGELRTVANASDGPLSGIDRDQLARTARALRSAAEQVGPAVETAVASGALSADTVSAVGRLGSALAAADASHRAGTTPSSLRGLIGNLRDPEVRNGLGYLLAMAKSIGAPAVDRPPNPEHSANQNDRGEH